MKRLAGVFAIVLVAGCGVGDPDEVPPMPNGRVCTSVLSTMGSFTPDTAHPQPTDSSGCWPYGMWTFSARVEMNDCTAPPTPLGQYQMRVDYSLDPETQDPLQTYVYVTDPTVRHTVKVTQGGAGLCEGELTLYSPDGKIVWLLKPALFADNSILGDGEYTIYNDNQWPHEGNN
jgi:hypothetical protein